MKYIISFLLLLALTVHTASAQKDNLSGDWEGYITIQGTNLIIKTHFENQDSGYAGTIDIPQQGASGLALQDIRTSEQDSVFFGFIAGMGSMAEFKGQFQDDVISGSFIQNEMPFPFKLSRVQTNGPLPYNQKEFVIANDSIKIGGTLTWPQDEKAEQLVIIISGSGAQNRDGELPITNFKPYVVLADSLTRRGIATFRYDDRGVGESTGNFGAATLNMLASDVEAIITEFTKGTGQNFEEIILLGHSQGGVVAGKVAAETKLVDKLVLMASTGISLKELLRFQVQQSFESANINDKLIKREIDSRVQLMDAIKEQDNIEKAREQYRTVFEEVQLSAGVDSSQAAAIANQQTRQLVSTFQAPQVQSLLYYNPTSDLARLNIPTFVVFGGKDTQVTTELNQAPIEQALDSSGAPYVVKIFEDANHLFQKANTGQAQEYGSLDSEFIDGFTETLAKWIKE